MTIRVWIATLALCSLDISMVNSITDGFAQQLQNFAQGGLQVDEMQGFLDTNSGLRFTSRTINGTESLQQVADLMADKYRSRIAILESLRDELENSFSDVTSSNPYTYCSDVVANEFDSSLQQNVDYNNLCVTGNGLDNNPSEFLSSQILSSWRNAYEQESGLQYIYFGSEEGILYNYPALNFVSADYDPRFRPFYVETVTPEPKDVVIVIDKSGSMSAFHNGRTLMSIANEAAQTVIDTLNANDRVGVVAFSDSAETPYGTASTSSCYSNQLAMATYENVEYLKSFVSTISYGGGTQYRTALSTAFAFFTNTADPEHDSRQRSKVIIFLTDGQPNDGHGSPYGSFILDDITDLNAQMNNSVVIITFGLGSSLSSSAQTLLQNMADQINNDEQYGDVTPGERVLVGDPDNLRSEMATYYNLFLQLAGQAHPTFTIPYQDAFGSGLIASICLPVRVADNSELTLKGSICIDQTFGELVSELIYFQVGEESYSFMVDQNTRVLEHPYLENPTFVTNTPSYTYLSTLETGDQTDLMVASIRSGESGNIETSATRVVARGDAELRGVNHNSVTTHYRWTQVEGTDYTIGLAIIEGDTETTLNVQSLSPDFFYHKLQLESQIQYVDECAHFGAVASTQKTSVHFSLAAFEKPFEYFYDEENVNDLLRYRSYFTDLHGPSTDVGEFKDQINEYVSATAYFNSLVTEEEYELFYVWRYLATENGVFRNFPATEIPKDYDATERNWYKQAKSNRDVMTLTAPYEDALGAGTLVSILHVIYEGSSEHNTDTDLIIGVMGMDFTPAFVYYMMTDHISLCETNECLLIDRAGYVVVHHNWIESPSFYQNVYNVHISQIEPDIALDLIGRNILTRHSCINTEEKRKQYYWRVSLSVDEVHDPEYSIYSVDDTNIFLIVKLSSSSPSYTCDDCSGAYGSCSFTIDCSCPCYSTDNSDFYNYCEGEFDLSSDTDPICTAALAPVDYASVQRSNSELNSCYDYTCDQRTTSRDCTEVIGCSWCLFKHSGAEISNPYCATLDVCPNGVLPQPDSGSGNKKEQQSLWWIILIFAGVGVIAFFAAGIYFCATEKSRINSSVGNTTSEENNSTRNRSHSMVSITHGQTTPRNSDAPRPLNRPPNVNRGGLLPPLNPEVTRQPRVQPQRRNISVRPASAGPIGVSRNESQDVNESRDSPDSRRSSSSDIDDADMGDGKAAPVPYSRANTFARDPPENPQSTSGYAEATAPPYSQLYSERLPLSPPPPYSRN